MTGNFSPGSAISRSLDLYKRNAGVLLPVAAVLFAIQFVAEVALPTGLASLLSLLLAVLTLLYQGFVVQVVSAEEAGQPATDVAALVRQATPALGSMIGVAILYAIGVGIGFILIIIPGLYLLTVWSVVIPVTVLERPGVFAAFSRSRQIVRGNGWNVFGTLVLVFVLAIAVDFVAILIIAAAGHAVGSLVLWALAVAFAPFEGLLVSVIYFALVDRAPGVALGATAGGPQPGWDPAPVAPVAHHDPFSAPPVSGAYDPFAAASPQAPQFGADAPADAPAWEPEPEPSAPAFGTEPAYEAAATPESETAPAQPEGAPEPEAPVAYEPPAPPAYEHDDYDPDAPVDRSRSVPPPGWKQRPGS